MCLEPLLDLTNSLLEPKSQGFQFESKSTQISGVGSQFVELAFWNTPQMDGIGVIKRQHSLHKACLHLLLLNA